MCVFLRNGEPSWRVDDNWIQTLSQSPRQYGQIVAEDHNKHVTINSSITTTKINPNNSHNNIISYMNDATSSTHTNHLQQVPKWRRSNETAGHSFGLFRSSSQVKKELITTLNMSPTTHIRLTTNATNHHSLGSINPSSNVEDRKSMKKMKTTESSSTNLDLNLSLKISSSSLMDQEDHEKVLDGTDRGRHTDLSLSLCSSLFASTSTKGVVESERCSGNRSEEDEEKKRKRESTLDLTL